MRSSTLFVNLCSLLVVFLLFCFPNENLCETNKGQEKFYGLVVVEQPPPPPSQQEQLDFSSSKTLKVERNNPNIQDEKSDRVKAKKDQGCHYEIDIEWSGKLPSNLFRGPVVTTFKFGVLEKVLLFFSTQYFEILEAKDGTKLHGFPFVLPQSQFIAVKIASGSGFPRMALTTTKGEIIFVRLGGTVEYGSTLIVPPLGVEKNWYEGLQQLDEHASVTLQQQEQRKPPTRNPPKFDFDLRKHPPPAQPQESAPLPPTRAVPVQNPSENPQAQPVQPTRVDTVENPPTDTPVQARRLLSLQEAKENYYDEANNEKESSYYNRVFELFEGSLPSEGLESLELFLPTESSMSGMMALQHEQNVLESRQYDKYLRTFEPESNLVYLEPKVMASPAVADLNQDRVLDLIVPVTYSVTKVTKDVSIDPKKYVACSLVVFDMKTQDIMWRANLDLTTATAHYQAWIQVEPVIVDLNSDGHFDVIVATGVGHIFAFDHTGKLHEGYPLRTHPVRAEPLVYDIDNDAILDLIVVDVEGYVKVWNVDDLSLKWETKISPDARSMPSLADINSDGILDLILGTGSGHIWALSGTTGDVIGGFPVSTGMRVHVPISLLDMNGDSIPELFVSGAKSQVYIIDPTNLCLEVIDLAEPIANPVAIDDMNGDGYTDLVIVSSRGSVYSLTTNVPFHPLHTWTDNGGLVTPPLYREHQFGVMIDGERVRYYYGPSYTVTFTVIDKRKIPQQNKKHTIEIRVNGEVVVRKELAGFVESSQEYSETIDCPRANRALVEVILYNQFSQPFYDSVDAHFNWNYYRTLKWLVVLPYLLMVGGFMLIKQISSPLPS